jgi:hypothetical protein
MMRLSQFASTIVAIAGIFVSSVMADAGVVRRPGNPEVVAPPATGYNYLISTSYGVGDLPPSIDPDYDFNIGFAPGIRVNHAGTTVCNISVYVDCWGEYLPNEVATFGGGIWGGHPTAILEFTLNIKDGDGLVVYSFDQTATQASVLGYYEAASTPGNPCVDIFLYNENAGCQYFEVALVLPTDLLVNDWYYAQWQAAYVAPEGLHFATAFEVGDPIADVTDRLASFSEDFRFKRIAPVEEPSALLIIILGGIFFGVHMRRRLVPKKQLLSVQI